MANSVAVLVTEDGPHNVVAKVTMIVDTADVSGTTVLDPATLNATFPPTDQLAIEEIQYSVQDGIVVVLYWDATTPKRIVSLTGRGIFPVGPNYGGIQNNAGVGKNGKITVSTVGFTMGVFYATLIIHCNKQTSVDVAGESDEPILTELGIPLQTEAGQTLLTE